MVMRIQQVDGEYRVVLSPAEMEALHVTEGSMVEIKSAETPSNEPVCASDEEAMTAFLETEPEYRESYLELAK